jgi:hypothetical protein
MGLESVSCPHTSAFVAGTMRRASATRAAKRRRMAMQVAMRTPV